MSQNSFKSVIYKTLSNGSKQSSNVWVNIIEDIEIQEDYDLLCASISNDENDVNFTD